MTQDEIKQLVREVLREDFGSYLSSDGKVILNKSIQILPPNAFNGSLGSSGGTAGVFGQATTRAAAISAPTSPGGTYSQAEAASAVSAINYLRTALANFGITN